MTAATHRWLSLGMLLLAVGAAIGFALQRQSAAVLAQEVALLREENGELARLHTANARLKASQAPAAEIERLRADRAAVMSLRAEIEAMKARAERRSQP